MMNDTTKRQTLALIDGHSLAYRMYFALERTQMRTKQGVATWAVFGFFKALMEFMRLTRPDGIALAFDRGRKTFRTEMYEEYKAHRDEMPDDMREQMTNISLGIAELGIPVFTLENYEADDLLGTLAKQGVAEGLDVTILTGDQDAYQLIDENNHTTLMMPTFSGGLSRVDWDKVVEKWGVTPHQVPDFKGLKGDTSDNIPGVPGVGDKTAAKLLNEFVTLEGIYDNIDKVAGKLREKLANNKEQAFLSKQLATIDCESPVALSVADTHLTTLQIERFVDFLQAMECRSLVQPAQNLLPSIANHSIPAKAVDSEAFLKTTVVTEGASAAAVALEPQEPHVCDFTIVETIETLKQYLAKAVQYGVVCLDIETTGLDYIQDEMVSFSLSISPELSAGTIKAVNPLGLKDYGPETLMSLVPAAEKLTNVETIYVPLKHIGYAGNLPFDETVAALKDVFENENVIKIAHNAKFESHFFKQLNVGFKGLYFDTMVASYVLDPERGHGLKTLGPSLLGLHMQDIKALIGSGKKQLTFNQVDIESASKYATLDTDVTIRLAALFASQLAQTPSLQALFYELELPLVSVLTALEHNGVSLDTEYLKNLSNQLELQIGVIEGEIYDLAGLEFNINSPKQVGEVLFEHLKLPSKEKNASKSGLSTNAKVLEGLAEEHPIVQRILDYRQLFKLKSTYIDALPELISSDGRLHASFNQAVTATGRLSSNNPNLQNIPVRSELGRSIRKAFVPKPGGEQKVILSADYSQIELRLLAHFSQDKNLCEAFNSGKDIHQATAALVFNVPLENVTKEMRYQAKAVNFGVIYGQTAYGLSRSLGILPLEASQFIATYFEQYPSVKGFIEGIKAQAHTQGYVETIFGRRRDVREGLASTQRTIREFTERAAFNTPLQGSGSDLMKLAMIRLQAQLEARGLQSQLILQVHDEVVLEVLTSELEEVKELVKWALELEQPLNVPLVIDMAYGPTWLEAD